MQVDAYPDLVWIVPQGGRDATLSFAQTWAWAGVTGLRTMLVMEVVGGVIRAECVGLVSGGT